jgi:hypothetical protein
MVAGIADDYDYDDDYNTNVMMLMLTKTMRMMKQKRTVSNTGPGAFDDDKNERSSPPVALLRRRLRPKTG